MKKKHTWIAVTLLLVFAVMLSSCARRPSPKRVRSLETSHFKKYGRQYPETLYANKITQVDILSSEELHKHLIAVITQLHFDNGASQKIRMTFEKKPLGWQIVSWEAL